MLPRHELPPSPRSSAGDLSDELNFEAQTLSKAGLLATQNGQDPYSEVYDWLTDRGCSQQELREFLDSANRITIPLEDDIVCLQRLRSFAQREEQGSPKKISKDVILRFQEMYKQSQADFDSKWNAFRWAHMIEMGLSLRADIACEWNRYLSSNAHNAARRIYMAIGPCIASCHSNSHSHTAQSKITIKRKVKQSSSMPKPTLRRSSRIRQLSKATKTAS